MKQFLVALFTVTMVLFIGQASAANLSWVDGTPASSYSNEDWALVATAKAKAKALNDTPDGETVKWSGKRPDVYGSLTPVSTVVNVEVTCRILKMVNNAKGQTGGTLFKYCQAADGEWKTE